MNNFLVKGMAYDRQARMIFASNAEMVRTIGGQQSNRHELLLDALGSALTIASLLKGTLKDRQRISLTIRTAQPSGRLFADADAEGNVRGYLDDSLAELPTAVLDRMSLRELIGDKGCIQMVKDIGMSRSVTGITDMPYGNLTDDMAHYYRQSEQTPTWFAADRGASGKGELEWSFGLLIQVLPGSPSSVLDSIRQTLDAWPSFVAAQRGTGDVQAFCGAARLLCPSFEALAVEPLRAWCGCSNETMLPMLGALGRDELLHTVRGEEEVEIRCRICGKSYSFAPAEVRKLL